MINALQDFFYMNGHGIYVWSAYGSVLIFLVVQWFLPWRKWRQYLQRQNQQK